MNSILTSIKKLLGITEDCTDFDMDIIIHINSVFMILQQLGVGPPDGFTIKDKTTEWSEYLIQPEFLEAVKTYVYLKVRLLFDPPQTSALIESTKNLVAELEWRLNVQVDPGEGSQNELESSRNII